MVLGRKTLRIIYWIVCQVTMKNEIRSSEVETRICFGCCCGQKSGLLGQMQLGSLDNCIKGTPMSTQRQPNVTNYVNETSWRMLTFFIAGHCPYARAFSKTFFFSSIALSTQRAKSLVLVRRLFVMGPHIFDMASQLRGLWVSRRSWLLSDCLQVAKSIKLWFVSLRVVVMWH